MAEIAQTAERLVVIGRGRLIADHSVAEIVAQASKDAAVDVQTPQAAELAAALRGPGVRIETSDSGRLEIHGHSAARIGELAAERGIVLHELVARRASLEDAFIRLTGASVEFHAEEAEAPEVREVAA
jgi:ABC-2 type transport system ATP-binding protein